MAKKRKSRFVTGDRVAEAATKYGLKIPEGPTAQSTVSPKEVAEMFGVTPEAVKYWIYNGKLPAIKLSNGYWRVRTDDLNQFIQNAQSPRMTVLGLIAQENLAAVEGALQGFNASFIRGFNSADAALKVRHYSPGLIIVDFGVADAWKFIETTEKFSSLRGTRYLLLSPKAFAGDELNRILELKAVGCLVGALDIAAFKQQLSPMLQQA